MKNTISIILIACFGMAILSGCSSDRTREEKVSAMITKVDSPFLIVSMTPQNLMDKSGIRDGVLPFTYELILSFFIDESVTGIDYGVKSQIVVGKGESFQPSMYGIFKIKDEKKFIELIEKEANATIVEKEGMKTAVKESDGYAVVWNEEFAVISNVPVDIMAMLMGTGDNGGEKTVNKCIELIKAAEDGEPNQTYTDFLNKPSDISLYYDGKGFYGYMQEMMGEEVKEIESMRSSLEGVTSEIYLNFNEGNINLEFINHLTAELKEKLNFVQEKGVEGKLLSYAYSEKPFMTGAYNINFAKFFDYLQTDLGEEAYEEMEEEIELLGLTVEDVKKSLTGQFVYMIDRVAMMEQVYDFGYGEPYVEKIPMPIFAVALGVADPSALQHLLADSLKLPNGTYKLGDGYAILDGDVFFASNDSAWTNKVLAKSTQKIVQGADVLAANPFSVFMDFTALAGAEGMDEAAMFLALFNKISGGASLDGGNFTIEMIDNSKNALRVLTEAVASELDRMEKESNQEMEQELEDAVLEGLEEVEEEIEEALPQ